MAVSEKIQGVNPDRIQWCCYESGITVDDLALHVDVALPTIEKALAGEPALTANQLSKIARFFNRGILFFLDAEPVNEHKMHSAQFRTLTNQKPHLPHDIRILIERVEKQRKVFLSLLEETGEEAHESWKPRDFHHTESDIKKSAALTREWLGLSQRNTFETYRNAIEAKGFLVFLSNGYKGPWQIDKENPVRGFSMYFPVCPVIMVKKQGADAPQSFTLMHELAHLLLHGDSFVDEELDLYSYQGKEKAANAFAGQLLVPDEFLELIDIETLMKREVEGYDDFLWHFRKQWAVSGEVILRRLLDEGRLTQEKYKAYRDIKKDIHGKPTSGGARVRFKEPLRIFGGPFVRSVFDALHQKKITVTKASTYLDNIKISDLRQLEYMNVHI